MNGLQGAGDDGRITAVVYVSDSYGASSRVTTQIYVTVPQLSVSDLQNQTESLLSDALGSGSTDVIFQVVGAGAGILNDKECTDPSKCESLRESFLSFIFNASATQVSLHSNCWNNFSSNPVLTSLHLVDLTIQEADQDSLGQQASALSSLTSVPDQLSGPAQTLALSMISSIASSSAEVGITTATATAVGDTITSLFSTSALESDDAASAISSSINDLSAALWVGVSPGEQAIEISTDSLKVSTEVNYATNLAGKGLKPPGTKSELSLPGSGLNNLYVVSDDDEVSTAIISLPNVHTPSQANTTSNITVTTSVNSNVLRLSLGKKSSRRRRRLLADGTEHEEDVTFYAPLEPRHRKLTGSDYVTVVMESSTPQSAGSADSVSLSFVAFSFVYLFTQDLTHFSFVHSITAQNASQIITLECDWDEFGVKTAQCDSGASFNITCEGRKTSKTQTCSLFSASVCAYWTGSTWLTSCDVYETTTNTTTCHCYNLTDALQTAGARRLQTVGEASADLALIVGTVGGSFIDTFNTPLSAAILAKNATVFIAIGSFLSLTLLLVIYGSVKDAQDKKRRLKKGANVQVGRPLSPSATISGSSPRTMTPRGGDSGGTPRETTESPRPDMTTSGSKRPAPLLDLRSTNEGGVTSPITSKEKSIRNYNFSSSSSEDEHAPDLDVSIYYSMHHHFLPCAVIC